MMQGYGASEVRALCFPLLNSGKGGVSFVVGGQRLLGTDLSTTIPPVAIRDSLAKYWVVAIGSRV